MTETWRLGIDLGGTKIEAAVLDAEGRFIDRRRTATPPDYGRTLAAIAGLVDACESAVGRGFQRLGVGVPGSPSPRDGQIRNANSTWLNSRPLEQDLQERLGRRVRLANDANCMTLSEARDGAGAGAGSVFGVILGTGCGGGLVIRDQLIGGATGIAGEWGHVPLPAARPDEATRCWCGRRNCLETWLSGPGMARDHASTSGQDLSAHQIVDLARRGDIPARATLARHQDRLARGLGLVVNLLDPEVIVLAGGLSNAPEIRDGLAEAIRPHVFSDVFDTPIRPAAHGDSSGVRGAAWLWPF
ncbi:MAG: ROK family protein [Caulobacterales bacterium]|nr:ROK family protein [Caulobacterales bacterium]